MIPFHSNRPMDYNRKKLFTGGYLFLQSIYYGLKMDSICRKIRSRYKYEYDLNAILSDLIYTRVLEPSSKKSSFQAAKRFLKHLPMNSRYLSCTLNSGKGKRFYSVRSL